PAAADAGDRRFPLCRGGAARRAALSGLAGAARRRHSLLDADAPQRQIRRGRARVHPREERRQLVRRGQGDAVAPGQADRDRDPLGRGAALAAVASGVERAGARGRAVLRGARSGFGQVPVPHLPQPGRDRDRYPRRQARGCAAPSRGGLATCAAEDHPRPERAAVEEPNLFHLRVAMAFHPGLVDLSSGEISREIFVNADIYAEEQERVFARAWLHVGHESQIPNPGDYFVSSMGEESVILCRDRAGGVHVFLNSCRHRGMKVCRYDEGTTAVFTCPYHGWSYGTDGRLVGVPYFREAYHSKLDKEKWGLVEV